MYQRRSSSELALTTIAVLLIIAALKVTASVLQPLVLAYFCAVLCKPALDWLEPRMSRAFAVTIIVAGTSLVGVAVIWFVRLCVQAVAARSEFYGERFTMVMGRLENIAHEFSISTVNAPPTLRELMGYATDGIQSVMGVMAQTIIFAFMFIFLLMEFRSFHRKIVFGFQSSFSLRAIHSFDDITERFRAFFVTQLWVSVLTGVATTLWTWMVGVDFPLLWGGLAFLLNFVPYIGSNIAVVPPVIIALLQFQPDWWMAVLCLVGLGVIQNVIGNWMTPRMLGRSVALSPMIVFVAMLFWGWVWGVVGFFLSVPLTVATRILCENIDALRWVAILLSDGEDLPPLDGDRVPS